MYSDIMSAQFATTRFTNNQTTLLHKPQAIISCQKNHIKLIHRVKGNHDDQENWFEWAVAFGTAEFEFS